ncbi:hypothetical protein [Gemmatimonas groenlandica]|uniref:Uncharacterized protein n=1 Tax=Gemmatimonas groenlandica TaxID=2732249 RepID=A0A6M4ITD1_9BACT|nr:hypothetical protein [Gemmatimonas groenlandica]QJR37993.1 hypothetical protein HKW67_21910 [Gemmatimonas groenlandica]
MNRRALFTDDRDLAALVREATFVAPSSALLDRVHASRADGLRVMLPSGEAAAVPVSPTVTPSAIDTLSVEQLAGRVWMIVIAVAATLVAAVTSLWSHRSENDALPATAQAVPRQAPPAAVALADSTTSAAMSSRESRMEALSPWPRVAFAQSPGAADRNAPYPGLAALDVSRLKPGRRTYLRSVGNALHALLPFTTYTVELDSAVLEKQRTWCLVTVTQTSTGLAENSERNAQYDTVWLRRNDLRPVRRSRYAGFMRMRQTFTDSTLVETDSLIAPRGKRLRNGMTLMPFRNGAFRKLDTHIPFVPTEETMRLLLRAAPLHERWRASVGALSGDDRSFAMGESEYLNLRVDGSRDIQTLSGRYATWRVILETGRKPDVWYVSKETGETLLTEGAWGVSYPVSETRLMYGFEETNRQPSAGSR